MKGKPLQVIVLQDSEAGGNAVEFTAETPVNNSFNSVNYVLINVTFSSSSNFSAGIMNASTLENNTPILQNLYFYKNFTTLADGNYSFIGWVNLTDETINETENRTIVIDTTAPTIDAVKITSNATGNFCFV